MAKQRAPKFVIFSGEHRAFWRKGGIGYTVNADLAGEFYFHQAERLLCSCGPEKMLTLCEVRRLP